MGEVENPLAPLEGVPLVRAAGIVGSYSPGNFDTVLAYSSDFLLKQQKLSNKKAIFCN